MPTQHLQYDVLSAHPFRQFAREVHAPDFRHPDEGGLARHRQGDVHSPGPKAEHAATAGRRGMAVTADQHVARLAGPLHVRRVTDAGAGPAVPDLVFAAGGAEEQVLLRIQVIGLDQIVVDVLDSQRHLDALGAHRLQFQHDHDAQHIL